MAHRVSSRPKKSEQKSVKVEEIDLITRKPQKSRLHLPLHPPQKNRRTETERREKLCFSACVRVIAFRAYVSVRASGGSDAKEGLTQPESAK